jgi:hypothetical protein
VADTLCMPPLLVAILTLLSSEIEGYLAAHRIGLASGRGVAAAAGHPQESFPEVWRPPPRRRGRQPCPGFHVATQALIVAPAGQRALTEPDWSDLRPLRIRIPTKRCRAAGMQVGPAEA